MRRIRRTVRYFVVMILILLLLFSLLYAVVFIYFDHGRTLFLSSYIRQFYDEFHITRELYGRLARAFFHLEVDTREIKELFSSGVNERDAGEKNRKRQELYERLLPLFHNLQEVRFRQINFHEPGNISYLRMLRPETYGDDLTGIRTSVELVNKGRVPLSGFEEGKIFHGYRFLFPLYTASDYLGSVEFSVSMGTVLSTYTEIYGHEMQFILLREQMEKKVFDQEQRNYVDWEISREFVLDKEFSDYDILGPRVPRDTALRIESALKKNRPEGLPFALSLKIKGRYRLLTFLPINNFEDRTVAYVFTLDEAGKLKTLRNNFYILIIVLTVLLLSTIGFFCYFFYSRSRIQQLSRIDYLTGISTRAVVYEEIQREMNRYRRYGKTLSVMIADVDHFKKINDTHGHIIGDKVLCKIADLLNLNIRTTDTLGRFGGEEFVILLPETTLAQAIAAAAKLRGLVESHLFDDAGWVTVSMGVAQMDEDVLSVEQLVEKADKSLYEAKKLGRNRVIAL